MMTMQLVAEEKDGSIDAHMDARELEASVLNKAAEMIEDVVGHWQEDVNHKRLDSALRYNQALWGVFQAELISDRNMLPMDLRQNILTLSDFVDKRTFEVMACPEPEKLDILIKINRGLAEGLRA